MTTRSAKRNLCEKLVMFSHRFIFEHVFSIITRTNTVVFASDEHSQ